MIKHYCAEFSQGYISDAALEDTLFTFREAYPEAAEQYRVVEYEKHHWFPFFKSTYTYSLYKRAGDHYQVVSFYDPNPVTGAVSSTKVPAPYMVAYILGCVNREMGAV